MTLQIISDYLSAKSLLYISNDQERKEFAKRELRKAKEKLGLALTQEQDEKKIRLIEAVLHQK